MPYFKHKRKKKDSNKGRILVTSIIAIFMITSIMGFMSNQNQYGDDVVYGSATLKSVLNGWTYDGDGYNIMFYSNPFEVESIELSPDAVQALRTARIAYLTFDSNLDQLQYVDLLRFELEEQLPEVADTMVIQAVDKTGTTYQLPVIDCNNATMNIPVIYLKQGERSRITYFNYCLVLEAPSSSLLLRLKDRLMYGLVDIIK